MSESLDDFLAQQGSADSEGQFTVAWSQRQRKLREFQLEHPSLYLLKVVQAAVACAPEEIRIFFPSDRVQLEFELPDHQNLHPETVLEALCRPSSGPPPSRALSHLVTGLNASLAVGTEVFWGLGREVALKLTEENAELVTDWPRPTREGANSFSFQLRKTSRDHLAEKRGLRFRCNNGPVPILLEGQRLCPAWPPTESTGRELARRFLCEQPGRVKFPLVNLAARKKLEDTWVKEDSGRTTSLDNTFAISWSDPEQALAGLLESQPYQGGFALPQALAGPSQIIFVKDGVRLEPFTVPGCDFGALAVLPGDHLAVDLSQFRVLEDQSLDVELALVKEQWGVMVDFVARHLARLAPDKVGYAPVEMNSWGGLATLPGLDLLYGLASLIAPLLVRKPDPVAQGRFLGEVRSRLDRARQLLNSA